jgi:hypothetical protein
MAYTPSTLQCVVEANATGNSVWMYTSADSAATLAGAGYISDAAPGTSNVAGAHKGMQINDIVLVVQTTAGAATALAAYAVSAISAAGAATILKTTTA